MSENPLVTAEFSNCMQRSGDKNELGWRSLDYYTLVTPLTMTLFGESDAAENGLAI